MPHTWSGGWSPTQLKMQFGLSSSSPQFQGREGWVFGGSSKSWSGVEAGRGQSWHQLFFPGLYLCTLGATVRRRWWGRGGERRDPLPSCPSVLPELCLPPNSVAPPHLFNSSPISGPLSPPHAPTRPNAFSSPLGRIPPILDSHTALPLQKTLATKILPCT